MHTPPASRARLESALAPHGLRVRGGWVPTASDVLPLLSGSQSAVVVWMVGQVGSECWSAFSASPFFSDGLPDPMDRWSKSIGDALAQELDGVALYPSDGPPYHPFQQWSQRAEPLQTSPLMLQIHPEYGLWHACRFALLLPQYVAQDASVIARRAGLADADLCLNCNGQPCLGACPVRAFTPGRYDVDSCAVHLQSADGQPCTQTGCLARRACPVAAQYRYSAAHAAFHMAAFANRHSDAAGQPGKKSR